MGEKLNAQTPTKRQIIECLDREFARLHVQSCEIIKQTSAQDLYKAQGQAAQSVGDAVLRCVAAIERTFGGITSSLWDDPFEWTLPEQLSTTAKIIDHLNEVEDLRRQAFVSFSDDSCLVKQVATPPDKSQPLIALLLETLAQAANYQGQALAAQKTLSR